MTSDEQWTVRLGSVAQTDYQDILRWTAENFGPAQAHRYAAVLDDALDALHAGPAALGSKMRDDLQPGVMTLHIARQKNKGRHYIAFRVLQTKSSNVIEVLRILHDAMDLGSHL